MAFYTYFGIICIAAAMVYAGGASMSANPLGSSEEPAVGVWGEGGALYVQENKVKAPASFAPQSIMTAQASGVELPRGKDGEMAEANGERNAETPLAAPLHRISEGPPSDTNAGEKTARSLEEVESEQERRRGGRGGGEGGGKRRKRRKKMAPETQAPHQTLTPPPLTPPYSLMAASCSPCPTPSPSILHYRKPEPQPYPHRKMYRS